VTDTGVLAVLLAAATGVLAGRAWASSRRRAQERTRPSFRSSSHYTEGLHFLATGQLAGAIHELTKVLRDHPGAVEVQQVLSHLYREVGKVERAIEMHRALLARSDLTRAERAHTLASLGTDYRRAGFLDRAGEAYAQALEVDPNNLHALAGRQKLFEEQRLWHEAYEA
jgi:lipopolysaccharide biosynthesis regulator YciM